MTFQSRWAKIDIANIYKGFLKTIISWAQLLEGGLALNPGLNLTRVSFSCVQKHFLG